LIDSGIGGYSFLKGIAQNENEYILIMDRAFFPYGSKKPDFLIKRAIFLCWYLKRKKVDMIILACNTLSVIVLDEIKPYFKIPIIGVIELFNFASYRNALFIGTENTVKNLKNKYKQITFLATPKLISYIEKNDIRCIQEYLKERIYEIRGQRVILDADLSEIYGYILLGCTHFIKIKHLIKNGIAQDDLFNHKMLNGIGNT